MTPARILIADDDPAGRYLLVSTLTSAGYETYTAEDGAQALAVARGEAPDLIITDILMPQMDGYQLCREWEADPSLAHIPFIFYTANYADEEDERFALSLGADRFLRKPLEPGALLAEVKTLLENHRPSGVLPKPTKPADEARVLREYNARLVSKLERQLEEVQQANDQLVEMMNGTVRAVAKLTEARDPYTSGHQERVADLAAAIARRMGHDHLYCEGIRTAGLVHDIGKIAVPAEILAMPRRLTAEEFALIRVHPGVGHDVLSGIRFPWPVAEWVLQHHERIDGSGYPAGLEGDEIDVGARILAVADVVEAMSSHRPYKTGAGIDAALEEIEQNAGRFYDIGVAAACIALFREDAYSIPLATNGTVYSR